MSKKTLQKNIMRITLRNLLVAIYVVSLAVPATSQQTDGLSFGFGALAARTPYNDTTKTRLVPSIRYQTQNLTVGFVEGVQYKFLSREILNAYFAIKPRMAPYSNGETTLLAGMTRKQTIDLAIKSTFEMSRGTSLIFKAASELTDEHKGHEFEMAIRQYIPRLGTPVFITAGVKRLSTELSHFLYGISTSESLANRVTFSPGEVYIPYFSANTIYGLTDSINIFGNTSFNIFPNRVFESPIVEEQTALTLVAGLSFTF